MTGQISTSELPWERRGAISIANGSTTVTGVGTAFKLTVSARDALFVSGAAVPLEIKTVVSDTELELEQSFDQASINDADYIVWRGYSWNLAANLAVKQSALLEKWQQLQGLYIGETLPEKAIEGDVFFNTTDPNDIKVRFYTAGEWQAEKTIRGLAATIDLGDVLTGQPGTQVIVENVGTNEEAILNITIPQGQKGDTGTLSIQQVQTGLPGTDVEIINNGTSEDANLSITIPRGDNGAKGDKGNIGNTGSKGDRGDSFAIDAQGLSSERINYDTEPVGFVFYETDNQQAFQRMGSSSQWIGPLTFGIPVQTFHGFRMGGEGQLLMDTGAGDFKAEDYAYYTILPGPGQFELIDGSLIQII